MLGRIGRIVLRNALQYENVHVVAVNEYVVSAVASASAHFLAT